MSFKLEEGNPGSRLQWYLKLVYKDLLNWVMRKTPSNPVQCERLPRPTLKLPTFLQCLPTAPRHPPLDCIRVPFTIKRTHSSWCRGPLETLSDINIFCLCFFFVFRFCLFWGHIQPGFEPPSVQDQLCARQTPNGCAISLAPCVLFLSNTWQSLRNSEVMRSIKPRPPPTCKSCNHSLSHLPGLKINE